MADHRPHRGAGLSLSTHPGGNRHNRAGMTSRYITTCVIPGCGLGIYRGQPAVRVRQWGPARITGPAHPTCAQESEDA